MTDTTPAEGTEGLSTAEALDALPIGAVVTDRHGDAITHDSPGVWTQSETASMGTTRLLRYGPFRVIYRPSTDRPTPPVPAAEDDAVEVRTADGGVLTATDTLRDERDFWRDAGYARMDERDEARQQVAELRADLAEARGGMDRWRGIANDLAAERDRLRAGIEALASEGEAWGKGAAVELSKRLRALLADTGQPGEGYCTCHPDRLGRTPDCGVREHRPAPVVPDSAGVRDEDWWAIRAMAVDLAVDVEAIDAVWAEVSVHEQERYRALGQLAQGVLAVVGQGVTVEHQHTWRWHQNVTTRGDRMSPIEVCADPDCDAARPAPSTTTEGA